MPAGAGDGPPVGRRQRRIERLQRTDRGQIDPLDAVTGGPVTEVGGQRFDFGQLRHGSPNASTQCHSVDSTNNMRLVCRNAPVGWWRS